MLLGLSCRNGRLNKTDFYQRGEVMTPRWKIKFKYLDGSVAETKLYYEDKQAAYDFWSKDFEIISIEQDTDTSHVAFINRIKNKAKLISQNGKKQLYKYPHNDSFILVKLYADGNDYYDWCEFQRWDCNGLTHPILWTVSNPKNFCKLFDNTIDKLPQGFVVTPREIAKIKAKKFYNKNGEVLWIDNLGYIYSADKVNLPNRHNKTEWAQFHDNPKAVFVEYVLATLSNQYGNKEAKWFESKESFLQFYQEEKTKVLSYATSPRYEIKSIGYKKLKPYDRHVILRLPYINLDMELSCGTPIQDIALSWSKLCQKSWQGCNFDCYGYLTDVVKHYKEWITRQMLTKRRHA